MIIKTSKHTNSKRGNNKSVSLHIDYNIAQYVHILQQILGKSFDALLLVLHNASMKHADWFSELPSSPSIRAASKKTGIQVTTLARQLNRGTIPAENVIKLCQAYGKSPITGLIETGYISPQNFQKSDIIAYALQNATNQQIANEFTRRLGTD